MKSILPMLGTLLLAASVWGQGQPEQRPPVAAPITAYPAGMRQELSEEERRLLEEAYQHFKAQDWVKAEKAYAQITEKNPKISVAWFRLGYCRHIQGRYEEAITLWEKSATFQPYRATAIYNQACAHALLNKKEKALSLLDAAIQAGFRDTAMIENDPDLESIRHEPRYKQAIARICSTCKQERYQQLAFLEGEWNVESAAGLRLGTSVIRKSENGFLLTESWKSSGGYTGTNFFYFDPSEMTWRLHWVTSTGEIIRATGDVKGKVFQAGGEHISPMDGRVSKYRARFEPLESGKVKLIQELSADGKEWRPYFEGIYSPSVARSAAAK